MYAVSALFFLLVTLPNFTGWYGYFIDEFYYIACANHPAFGYIDHPPLAPLLLRLSGTLLGYSLPAVRLLPALAGTATILVAGLLTAVLGGGRFAQFFSAFATAGTPVVLLFSGFFSMNPFEVLLWGLLVLTVALLLRTQQPHLWIIAGILAGLGLETKHTMILIVGALGAGLLVTPARRLLWSRSLWWGIAAAALLFLPNVLWEGTHDMVSLEFYREATRLKNVATPPGTALLGQILFMQPLSFPLWCAGLLGLLFLRRFRAFQPLGVAAALLLVLFLFSNSSRPDRIGGMYPMLFAAGSVLLEAWSARRATGTIRWTISLALLAGIFFALPYTVPIFPPVELKAYIRAVGWSPQIERNKRESIPQWFGDRLGWEDMVQEVARVYHTLTPEEQQDAVIFANNYGHAGAIDLLGPAHGLPPALSTHNSYYLWGPGERSGRVLVGVAVGRRSLERYYASVKQEGQTYCTFCPTYMSGVPVYVARGLKKPLPEVWSEAHHFE